MKKTAKKSPKPKQTKKIKDKRLNKSGKAKKLNATGVLAQGSKHNWKRAKDLYMEGKYRNYVQLAKGERIPLDVVEREACRNSETWRQERQRIATELQEEQAQALKAKFTEDYIKDMTEQHRVARIVRSAAEKSVIKQAKSKDGLPAWLALQGLSVSSNLHQQAGYREIGEGMLKRPELAPAPQHLTAIQQLVVVIKNSGTGSAAKVVDALAAKLSTGS